MGRFSQRKNNISYSNDPSLALEEIMSLYGTLVLRTAYFYLGDKYLAEDISQEVFMRAYRNWGKFRGDSSVKTWILKITINLCHDKKSVNEEDLREGVLETHLMKAGVDFNLEEEVLKRIQSTQILKHVLKLPLHYREVLYLYYYLDFNTIEIANTAGMPEGTVRGRLHRARKLLGELINKGEINE